MSRGSTRNCCNPVDEDVFSNDCLHDMVDEHRVFLEFPISLVSKADGGVQTNN